MEHYIRLRCNFRDVQDIERGRVDPFKKNPPTARLYVITEDVVKTRFKNQAMTRRFFEKYRISFLLKKGLSSQQCDSLINNLHDCVTEICVTIDDEKENP